MLRIAARWAAATRAAVIPDREVFLIGAPGVAYMPRVASDSAGNFLVTWTSWNGTVDRDSSIAARYYDIAGSPVAPEFLIDGFTAHLGGPLPAVANDGSFVVAWTARVAGGDTTFNVWSRRSGVRAASEIELDPGTGVAVSGNGVFEPGETLEIRTAWVNTTSAGIALSGTSPRFTGPAGANYTLNDSTASYGTIAAGESASCIDGADCYSVTLSGPAVRPVQHWDAQLQENLSIGVPKTWMLHIGESFADVATDSIFYSAVETLFHNGVTGGCFGGGYCPGNPVTRAQMAVFLLKSKFGAAHVPFPCTGAVFTDVPCTGSPFDSWIEELAALGVTGGCGGGLFCPDNNVTRQQMAVLLLKTLEGSGYTPPGCTPQFDDVPCPGQFADWISDLYGRGTATGCSAAPALYCPNDSSTRGQMAVFLTKIFGLALYGG